MDERVLGTGCGYSAVVNPVDVTGTIPSELSDFGLSPSRPSLDKGSAEFPEQLCVRGKHRCFHSNFGAV